MLDQVIIDPFDLLLWGSVLVLTGFFATSEVCGEAPFAEPKDIAGGSVSGVTSLAAGDINGDGRDDVVVLEGGKHAGGRKTVAWFKAPADPQDRWKRHRFSEDAPLRSFLGAAELADMDGDGDPDLIVSSDRHSGKKKAADVLVFENPRPNGDVTDEWSYHRANEQTLSLHHINDMEVTDMDSDGKRDIIVRSLQPNQIHIFFQNTPGHYEHRVIETKMSRSEGLAVGRLNGDQFPDISYTGIWLRSPEKPRSQRYERLPIEADYHNVNQNTKEAIGDIDGDGRNDVIIGPAEAYRGGKPYHLAWYRNPGKTTRFDWERHVISRSTNNHHTVELADIDNDGHLDAVVGIPWSGGGVSQSAHVYYNNGSGRFTTTQKLSDSKGLYSGVIADVDGDGDLDIIGQDTYSGESRPWLYENRLR